MKKQSYLDISMFILTSGIILFLAVSYLSLRNNINKERYAVEKEAELQELSYKLAEASDYLTGEVRKLTVTLNPLHLRNYWTEINVSKSREKVIARLQELKIPQAEFDLLNSAKNHSDDLVNTETRAMKLILRVYEVPEEQMEPAIRDYQLTNDEEKLSFNQKVNLAREILYDNDYEDTKKKIMDPIQEFGKTMRARIQEDTREAQGKTNIAGKILLFAILGAALYLIYLAWFMLYKVSIPLKNYLLSLEEEGKEADANLRNSQATDLIKQVLTSIKKNT